MHRRKELGAWDWPAIDSALCQICTIGYLMMGKDQDFLRLHGSLTLDNNADQNIWQILDTAVKPNDEAGESIVLRAA